MKIAEFLQDQKVEFDVIPHRETFEATRMAEVLHVPSREVAKTVLLRADHGYKYIVAIVPADQIVDLEQVSRALGGSQIELATELEIDEHCPDCESGALPPFGSQYGMKTIVDQSLAGEETIVFELDTHHEAIRMRFEDFRRIEQPLVVVIVAEPQLR